MASFALMTGDQVVEIFSSNPGLHPDLDVVDVSAVPGVTVGWWRHPDGSFQAAEPSVALTELRREAFIQELNADAEAARSAFLTSGSAKSYVYAQKLAEAQACDVDGTPTAPEYPLLNAMIGVEYNLTGTFITTLAEAADVVLARNATFKVTMASIENLLAIAKEAIRVATTEAQARTALNINWPRPSA